MKLTQKIKYEADRTIGFGRMMAQMPGCESLQSCIQCGTCSGTCPMSIYMDHTPRQVIGLVRGDFKKEVLSCNTIWLCSSCYSCTVECPRKIGITSIMYALKQYAIAEHACPAHFPAAILTREFSKMVRRKGRITETLLVIRLFLRANWHGALASWRLGLGLIRTGRFVLRQHRIKGHDELALMLGPPDAATKGGPS